MVFFICDGCGESLKKGQVEKHLAICRRCQFLSCIDCGKDFWGDDYKTHLKCLTEDEKYGGKGFEAKANKGDVKQQQWIQRIQEVMKQPNLSDTIRNILHQVSSFDNVPRKKAKFQNWMKNSLKIFNPSVQEQVWEIFAEATSNQKVTTNSDAPKPSNTPATKSKHSAAEEETEKKSKPGQKEEREKKTKKERKNGNSEEQLLNFSKKKGKKRKMEADGTKGGNDEANSKAVSGTKKKKKKQQENKRDDASEKVEEAPQKKKKRNDTEGNLQEEEADENHANENGEDESGIKGKFNWKGTIKALLRKAPDNELPIKKLKKKVIAQYYAISSEQHRSEEELLATFNKKIKNNPKFRVLKERVKLVK